MWCRWENTCLTNGFSLLEKLKSRMHNWYFYFQKSSVLLNYLQFFYSHIIVKADSFEGDDKITNLTPQP